MTQGYNNDQFYGLGGMGNGGNGAEADDGRAAWYSMAAKSNPDFLYPGRGLRMGDKTLLMNRGYIRTLLSTSQGEHIKIRKCGFQFNPEVLETQVQMSANVYNAMLLDPTQLTQPLLGSTNFVFTLFFDRSAEMSQGTPPSGTLSSKDSNLYTSLDPSEIGVFRDIGELNAIIGAGLSPETIKFAADNLRKQVNAVQTGPQAPSADVIAANKDHIESGITNTISPMNFGNSAFLLPQPVRAVFSSLFMVEGYVNSINIKYTKFSTAMVPMSALVTLSMEAVYVGYAKRKTFMTDMLDKAEAEYLAEQQALSSQVAALRQQLVEALPSLQVYLSTNQNEPATSNIYVSTALNGGQYALAWHNGGDVDEGKLPVPEGGVAPAFSVTAQVSMYGPYDRILDSRLPSDPSSDAKKVLDVKITGSGYSIKDIATKVFSGPPNHAQNPATSFPSKYYIQYVTMTVVATVGSDQTVTGTGSYKAISYDMNPVGGGDTCRWDVPLSWIETLIPAGAGTTIAPNGLVISTKPAKGRGADTPGSPSNIPPAVTPKGIGSRASTLVTPATTVTKPTSVKKLVTTPGYRGADGV